MGEAPPSSQQRWIYPPPTSPKSSDLSVIIQSCCFSDGDIQVSGFFPSFIQRIVPSTMDPSNSITVLWSRSSKPLGKVRRRVQDLRIPSFSSFDFIASRPRLDLSHNESTRLAMDCLLSQGLNGYHEMLKAEGEVDFLSNMEKDYILQNGSKGNTDAPVDEGKELESLSAGCESSSRYSEASTDSDSTVQQRHQSGPKDVRLIDPVVEDPDVEVFFLSDSRAASMKDLVRQFIRKAKMAVALVIDSFSDAELLCDLLEASRKRNVSVHLLLDHLNLKLFTSMWQDMKLDSRSFPKLSVRSVHGQTYCAKTGRKLTGQIAESFIITDWTEVLTGSYSFTWLSWQVHRSVAVLIRGSSVRPFQQELHRLHSSSQPVDGFVSFITLPQALCLHSTANKTHNMERVVSESKSNRVKTISLWTCNEEAEISETNTGRAVFCGVELQCREGGNQSVQKADAASHPERNPAVVFHKPLVQCGAGRDVGRVNAETPQHTVGANLEPIDQIQSFSNHRGQTVSSDVQSLCGNTTITPTHERNLKDYKPNLMNVASPSHRQLSYANHHLTSMSSNLNPPDVGRERVSSQQMQSTATKPLGFVSGDDPQRAKWGNSLHLQSKSELPSDPNVLFSTSQQAWMINSPQVPFFSYRAHASGLQTNISFLEAGRQDQTHSYLNTFSNSESPPAGMGTTLTRQLQPDSKMFLPGARAKMHLQPITRQQGSSAPRLNWASQNHHAAGPIAVARFNSFSSTTGKGLLGWSSMNTSLARSKSMTERRTASFRTEHQNRSYI